MNRFCKTLFGWKARPKLPQSDISTLVLTLVLAFLASSPQSNAQSRETLERHLDRSVEVYGPFAAIRLPINKGVPIWNPTAVRVAPNGDVFVANYVGHIYRIVDSDGDGLEDTAVLFRNASDDGLRYPTTMAFKGNDLFVGFAQQIRVYDGANGQAVGKAGRPFVEFPCGDHTQYWTFGLCTGPDGFFYVNLSTDSYVPKPASDPNNWRGSLLRISPDGRSVEKFAMGLRFAPGMAFDRSGRLFFSDNEGGGNPSEELNLALEGKYYGHNPSKFASPPTVAPLAQLSYGRGVCGIAFNSLTNEFGGTADDLFVAFWGLGEVAADGSLSRVKLLRETDGAVRAREVPFCNWFAKPFDLTFHPRGDLYVTQFGPAPLMIPSEKPTGAIYRFVHAPWVKPSYQDQKVRALATIRGDPEHGRKLFADRGCGGCHAVDGVTELLGPNLIRLGDRFRFDDVLRAVTEPSHSIRSGFESELFEMQDGDFVQGRILASDALQVTVMAVGNRVVKLPRDSIRSHRSSQISLMPEGLLANLTHHDVLDLFAYLGIKEYPEGIRWRYRMAGMGALGILVWLVTICLRKVVR